MGFLDRLFGRDERPGDHPQVGLGGQARYPGRSPEGAGRYGSDTPQDRVPGRARTGDEEAIARYRYLLDTAPPEKIEEAHAEAFAQLTPDQRRQVLEQLARSGSDTATDDSPRSLARAATRLEMRRPGSLVGAFGGRGGLGMGGMGMGGMGLGGMLLGSVAGAFVGTAIANEMFDHDGFMDWDTGGDPVGGDPAGGDLGDVSAAGDGGFDGLGPFGDLGGGDFGGGDFGGGDFGGFGDW